MLLEDEVLLEDGVMTGSEEEKVEEEVEEKESKGSATAASTTF